MEEEIKQLMGFQWIKKLSATEGETVNKNFVVSTDKGKYFIKWNSLPNVIFCKNIILLNKTYAVVYIPSTYA